MGNERFPTFRRIGSGIARLWREPRLLLVPLIRVGRWARRVAPKVGWTLLVLFVLAAIPWTYFNIEYGRELEAELARIKAAGEPLTLVEAAPKPVPDEQNAAVLYNEVFHVSFDREHGFREPGAPLGFSDIEGRNAVYEYVSEGSNEAKVREVLKDPRVRERLEILREASGRPCSFFAVRWEDGWGVLLPHGARFRCATRWVTAKMLMTAADGDTDGALGWCRVALRMSQHAASEPILTTQLSGIWMQAIALEGAEQVLSGATPSAGAATELQRYLAHIDLRQAFDKAMMGERAVAQVGFPDIRERGLGELRRFVPEGEWSWKVLLPIWASPVGLPLYRLDQVTWLGYTRSQMESMRRPYREAKPQLEALYARAEDTSKLAVLTRLFFPRYRRTTAKRDGAIARLDEFRIVLALKVYKQEHRAYPETLGELQKTLSWELPKDVFSGEPFRYHRKGEGFMVYSFGRDLDDDAGVREEDRKYQDGDIVWECSR